MSIITIENKNYSLLKNIIKIYNNKLPLILKLRSLTLNSLVFDKNTNLWMYKNNKLINILYPEQHIINIEFKNSNINDYREKNIIFTYDNRFLDNFILPEEYELIESGTPILINTGRYAQQYRNMYWKVKDKNNDIYYLMHIEKNKYTKISIEDIDKILNFKGLRNVWHLHKDEK